MASEDLAGLNLIETMRREPGGQVPRLDLHLARMAEGAAWLGWAFPREEVLGAVAAVPDGAARRVRVTLDATGRVAMQHAECPPNPGSWRLGLAGARLDSSDPWLGVKSTRRAVYDAARAALPAGLDEVFFLNERDEVCDGTITTVFLRRGGRLWTPPLRSGVLPGVLRRSLIASGEVSETVLRQDDLVAAEAVFVGNSLRGLIPVHLAL